MAGRPYAGALRLTNSGVTFLQAAIYVHLARLGKEKNYEEGGHVSPGAHIVDAYPNAGVPNVSKPALWSRAPENVPGGNASLIIPMLHIPSDSVLCSLYHIQHPTMSVEVIPK